MAENLDLNINIKTAGAEGSIGSLKKQLKEAQNEVVALSDKFGATSQQAVIAAKKAAELRDRIGDAKALTDAFNPDQKFRALTSSLSGVAGGFAAVQGAMGLFGSESENLQKTLVKVQSAMALSQGLEAVGNSIDSFKNLGTVIRTQVVTAFSTLRGAIIATGIGALAVGLGLVVANFDKIKETINNLFPSLGQFADKVKGIVQSVTDWAGITSQAARNTEELKKATDASIFSLDQSIKILQSQDDTEAEVYELKKQRIKAQISLLTDEKDETIKKRVELNTELTILDNQEQKRKQAIRDAEIEEAAKQEANLLQVELDAFEQRQKARAKMSIDAIGADGLTNKEREKAKKEDADRKKEIDSEAQALSESMLKDGLGKTLSIQAEALAASYKLDEDNLAAKKRIDELEVESKEASAYAIADIVAGLSSIIGQNTAEGKAVAIASATIDTYLSASTIFKQAAKNPITTVNPAYPYLMAAPALLAGIARVKSIVSVPVPNGGGGGSMPSMSSAAPIAPQLPTAQVTQLNQQSINDIGNNAVRAYVVESDVTSSQERITAIRQRARFS
jgi:hypothetical protein